MSVINTMNVTYSLFNGTISRNSENKAALATLRDLAAWVEDGVPPPLSTEYTISSETQVLVPEDVSQRFRIQPYVQVSVENGSSTHISSGSRALMDVYAEVPPGAGSIISIEWDYLGTGDFVAHELDCG